MTAMIAALFAAAGLTAPSPPPPGPAKQANMALFNAPIPAGKVTTANPRSIVAALQRLGYRAKLVTDDGARPYIESSSNGAKFYVYLESCKQDRDCGDAMLRSSYNMDDDKRVKLEAINAFNRETRWIRAYLDEEGDPVLEQDLFFTGQVMDEKMFDEAIAVWDDILGKFHKAIGW